MLGREKERGRGGEEGGWGGGGEKRGGENHMNDLLGSDPMSAFCSPSGEATLSPSLCLIVQPLARLRVVSGPYHFRILAWAWVRLRL